MDLTCAGTIAFAGGGVAQFDSSFELPDRMNFEIVGSDGLIVVPTPYEPSRHETLRCGPSWDRLEPIVVNADFDLYTYEVDDLTDAILDAGTPRVTLADSRENVATLLAVLASARSGGAPVSVEG